MARTIIDLNTNLNTDEINAKLKTFFEQHEYTQKDHKGEVIFERNSLPGLLAPLYIKVSVNGSILRVEGWIQTFFGKELAYDNGFVGKLPKNQLKKELDQIVYIFGNVSPVATQNINNINQPVMNAGNDISNSPQATQPQLIVNSDMKRFALVSILIGVISFLIWLFIPLPAYVILAVFITGILFAKKGLNSSRKGLAITGLVLNIVLIAYLLISLVINFIAKY